MLWIYFDASTLVKRYAPEVGTPLVNELFRRVSLKRMTCSTLGVLEIVSILTRKRNDGRISQTLFEQAMIDFKAEVIDREEFAIAPIDDTLAFSALELITTHNLNATDAMIMRSTLNLQQALREAGHTLALWTSDKRLVRAAQAEGMVVFDPEQETIERLSALSRQ